MQILQKGVARRVWTHRVVSAVKSSPHPAGSVVIKFPDRIREVKAVIPLKTSVPNALIFWFFRSKAVH
jgi:hypothetical protein